MAPRGAVRDTTPVASTQAVSVCTRRYDRMGESARIQRGSRHLGRDQGPKKEPRRTAQRGGPCTGYLATTVLCGIRRAPQRPVTPHVLPFAVRKTRSSRRVEKATQAGIKASEANIDGAAQTANNEVQQLSERGPASTLKLQYARLLLTSALIPDRTSCLIVRIADSIL
jgi:hypothetical protein